MNNDIGMYLTRRKLDIVTLNIIERLEEKIKWSMGHGGCDHGDFLSG